MDNRPELEVEGEGRKKGSEGQPWLRGRSTGQPTHEAWAWQNNQNNQGKRGTASQRGGRRGKKGRGQGHGLKVHTLDMLRMAARLSLPIGNPVPPVMRGQTYE